jgi:AAA15 family ATPase/GTPase
MQFGKFNMVATDSSLMEPILPLSIELDFTDTEEDVFYSYKILLKSQLTKENGDEFRFYLPAISEEWLTYKNRSHTGKAATIFYRDNSSVKYGEGIKKGTIISEIEGHNSIMRLLSIIKNSENISKDYKAAISALESILESHIFYFSPHLLRENDGKYENKTRVAYINLESEITTLEDKPFWNDFKLVLKNMLNIQDVKIFPSPIFSKGRAEKMLVFKQNNNTKLIPSFSDGTIVLLALITKLFSDTSDIFLIEEPENSIHPRALSELMKLIRRFSLDKQFIITTHSPYLLNMIKPEEVFVAALDKTGKSTISKLPNAKAIKKKLAKGFMDFGDIVFSESSIAE